jgi:hypothetical protein
MKQYALIFHATRALTPDEQKQRPIDISAWVKKVAEMGIELDPRNFEESLANFSSSGKEIISGLGPSDPTLVTIVYFGSPDGEQAVEIARIHPALSYGVKVEVREWSTPRVSALSA